EDRFPMDAAVGRLEDPTGRRANVVHERVAGYTTDSIGPVALGSDITPAETTVKIRTGTRRLPLREQPGANRERRDQNAGSFSHDATSITGAGPPPPARTDAEPHANTRGWPQALASLYWRWGPTGTPTRLPRWGPRPFRRTDAEPHANTRGWPQALASLLALGPHRHPNAAAALGTPTTCQAPAIAGIAEGRRCVGSKSSPRFSNVTRIRRNRSATLRSARP